MERKMEYLLDEVVGDMRRVICYAQGMKWFVLVGPAGAVQFAYIHLPYHLFGEMERRLPDGQVVMGADVGHHSYSPRYDGQYPMECEWLEGQDTCFYDGSGLQAIDWLKEWATVDFEPEWIWTRLYVMYQVHFGQGIPERDFEGDTNGVRGT